MLLGLKNVRAEYESAIAAALALSVQGIDFADAIYLSSRPPDTASASFDKYFVR